MTSRCWSATGVVAVGVVVGGVRRWATRDGDGDRGDAGEQEQARGHRGAWQGYGRYNYCH